MMPPSRDAQRHPAVLYRVAAVLQAEYRLKSPLNSTFGLPPPLQVGNIYQRFTSPEEGKVGAGRLLGTFCTFAKEPVHVQVLRLS